MARTIAEIKKDMADTFIKERAVISAYGLDGKKTFDQQFSPVSIENILFYVFAVALWTLEKLFDAHTEEVDDRIEQLEPHTLRWYVNKAKAFMFGYRLVTDTDYYDTTGMSETDIDAARVVKYAVATESNTVVYLKVAGEKEGSPCLLTDSQLEAADFGADPCQVDYGALYNSRYQLLRAAYGVWVDGCAGQHGCKVYYPDDYYAFTLANEDWLDDYALYMAIKSDQKMKPWTEWPEPYRLRDGEALARYAAENEEEIGFWKFLQYQFSKQWQKVKAYANSRGIRILGDMPIYVSADSVDAWVGGSLFELDHEGKFARVAGVPPDYFAVDGQMWGNPLYNWEYHRQTGFAWWIRRVRYATRIYDLVRIDHFRGFDTYWAIPAGSPTAKTGRWENGPGMELFRALENALGKLPIIAEDLGDLCDSVRQLLADSGFPGMKVLQFAFSGGDNEYLPHNHPQNSVVYPGTHDNTTLTDWWDNAATAKEKQTAATYLRMTPALKPTAAQVKEVKTGAARQALIRAALASPSARAIIPMYDWLGLGAEAHLNTPGRLGGNWAWRARAGFATAALAEEIRQECEVCCRAEPAVSAE